MCQERQLPNMLDTGDPISSNLLTTSLHCFPGGSDSKESGCSAADPGSILGLGRSLGEREWLSTPIFLLGEFHGQSSLAGYSPRSCKESDTTERLIQHSLQTMPGDYLTLYPRQHWKAGNTINLAHFLALSLILFRNSWFYMFVYGSRDYEQKHQHK